MRILNFGSLNLDYVYQVDHFARPGETLSCLSRSVKAGGKGLNQSVALSRAGAKVCHAGCIGEEGEELKTLLDREGVDTSGILRVPEMQGHTVIQVSREGENCILLFGGSNLCVTDAQITRTLAGFSRGDWLILQNELNCPGAIVNAAWERGMTIVLNPSPFDERLRDVDFRKVRWLLVNEVEGAQITGASQPDDVWASVHERCPDLSLLITLGSAGSEAWQMSGNDVLHARQEAFPVRAVDTTGAGDTYTGYFIAGLMAGRPLPACMRRAAKAASLSVTRPGAASSIPFSRELSD